jgi:transcriptional regulator with XRE-family HTH domain
MKYFGKQVRKARLAHGWTMAGLGQQIGYDTGQISRVETGKRPGTALFAEMCDRVFPEKDGWFTGYLEEAKHWLANAPWFRPWIPHEQATTQYRTWTLGIISGMLQTADYARVIISVGPGATPELIGTRAVARMTRQALITREDPEPPAMTFLVDECALRRRVGSAEIMRAQLRRIASVAQLPNVTIQVVPEGANAGLLGGFIIVDDACYIETARAGEVFEDQETMIAMSVRFDTIRAEALRASESLTLLERMCDYDWPDYDWRLA